MKFSNALLSALAMGALCGCASETSKRAEFYTPNVPTVKSPRTGKNPSAPPFTRAEAENDISGAVIHRFARDASGELKSTVGIVFVSFTSKNLDPDATFLKRFEGNKPRVLPMSSAVRSPENGYVEKQTGKRGLVLTIRRVDWIDFYNVEVVSAWSMDARTERTFAYHLSWKKKKWIVM